MADLGTGTTIAFATSLFAAQITEMEGGEMTREALDTSHLGTTVARTKIMSDLFDPGEMSITGFFDPALTPPVIDQQAVEVATITWPDSSQWVQTVGWASYQATGINNDGLMGFTATLAISGTIAISPGAGGTTT